MNFYTESNKQGSKFDTGKPPLGEIMQGIYPALNEVLEILIEGEKVHGLNNWQNVEYHRCKNALYRHYHAFMNGENKDKESNKSHLAHMICNCLFMIDKEMKEVLK